MCPPKYTPKKPQFPKGRIEYEHGDTKGLKIIVGIITVIGVAIFVVGKYLQCKGLI